MADTAVAVTAATPDTAESNVIRTKRSLHLGPQTPMLQQTAKGLTMMADRQFVPR